MSAGSSRWVLAIDYGTTNTVAAVGDLDPRNGVPRFDEVKFEGGSSFLPSVVMARESELLVGERALRSAALDPGAVAARAKLALGRSAPLVLAPQPIHAADAVTAVVAEAVGRALARQGSAPALVVATHPAEWAAARRKVLADAVTAALSRLPGCADVPVELLDEPVAAAVYVADELRLRPGARLAVLDVGGGTADAALVERTGTDSYKALPGSAGVEAGGEFFDDEVVAYALGRLGPGAAGRYRALADPEARQASLTLRTAARLAKEHLSEATTTEIVVPALPPEQPGTELLGVTRPEFEARIAPHVQRIVDVARQVAGGVDGLDRIFLIGGSAQVPAVRDQVRAVTGLATDSRGEPQLAVAIGAATHGAMRIGLIAAKEALPTAEPEPRPKATSKKAATASSTAKPKPAAEPAPDQDLLDTMFGAAGESTAPKKTAAKKTVPKKTQSQQAPAKTQAKQPPPRKAPVRPPERDPQLLRAADTWDTTGTVLYGLAIACVISLFGMSFAGVADSSPSPYAIGAVLAAMCGIGGLLAKGYADRVRVRATRATP
jgi:molecular chaperone DnaK (HSP70)